MLSRIFSETLGAAAIALDGITPANIITWLIIVCGWVASYAVLRNRVDAIDKAVGELQRVMDEMKTQGSPASRQSVIVINSRLESQNARILRVEDAVLELAEIKVHVEWMKNAMQQQQQQHNHNE